MEFNVNSKRILSNVGQYGNNRGFHNYDNNQRGGGNDHYHRGGGNFNRAAEVCWDPSIIVILNPISFTSSTAWKPVITQIFNRNL